MWYGMHDVFIRLGTALWAKGRIYNGCHSIYIMGGYVKDTVIKLRETGALMEI